jgi:hypothetical protein
MTTATIQDINSGLKKFYFKEKGMTLTITRMHPDDYTNAERWGKDKKKFLESCREDWRFKTNLAKLKLKENNLFKDE